MGEVAAGKCRHAPADTLDILRYLSLTVTTFGFEKQVLDEVSSADLVGGFVQRAGFHIHADGHYRPGVLFLHHHSQTVVQHSELEVGIADDWSSRDACCPYDKQ